jgi:hypothetical protein
MREQFAIEPERTADLLGAFFSCWSNLERAFGGACVRWIRGRRSRGLRTLRVVP